MNGCSWGLLPGTETGFYQADKCTLNFFIRNYTQRNEKIFMEKRRKARYFEFLKIKDQGTVCFIYILNYWRCFNNEEVQMPLFVNHYLFTGVHYLFPDTDSSLCPANWSAGYIKFTGTLAYLFNITAIILGYVFQRDSFTFHWLFWKNRDICINT